jgi:hypothetical protein
LNKWNLAVLPWVWVAMMNVSHAADSGPDISLSESAATPIKALTEGKLLLQLRPRYAYVTQSDKVDAAEGTTMRTLLGWQTRPWLGLSATVEMLNVGHLGAEHYASASTPPSKYPLIRDPDNTDANRLFLEFTGVPKNTLRWGRQELLLDNERMVGVKNFSQTAQLFDAVTLRNQFFSSTEIFLGRFWRARTTSATELPSDTSLLNVRYAFTGRSSLAGYGYFQNQPDTGQTTGFGDNSNRIAGLRLGGMQPIWGKLGALYTAEYAHQRHYMTGDDRINADYSRLGTGMEWSRFFLRWDRERLASNNGVYAFQTPIGSTHTFQGWADLFTTTPREGIIDEFATLGLTVKSVSLYAERHRFQSDTKGINFGRELDVRVSYAATQSLSARLEVANYTAGNPVAGKPDTRKTWLTVLYNY